MTEAPRPGPPPRVHFRGPSPSVRKFLATESAGSLFLLAGTVLALVWANSPWSESYHHLWETPAGFGIGDLVFETDLHHWVNDAAMAVFFCVIGLEITREIAQGELQDRRSVAVPALGALGGLLVPILIYLLINPSGEEARGWGIVMSTDTAFVLGILALFGPRCPDRIRIFLLTLAIVDDIGAITLMAVFYSAELSLPALGVSAALVGGLLVLRWIGVWRLYPYVLIGIALWFAVYLSGVHATLAGVAVGLLIPAVPPTREVIDRITPYGRALRESPNAERAQLAMLAVKSTVPANDRLQRTLHPWTAYVVIPVFALANAGVALNGETLTQAMTSSVTIGVALALVVGNTVGITGASVLTLRLGWGILPGGVRYSHLLGAAMLAGIGFTISLFISELAFADDELIQQAKIGILAGSLMAAVLGSVTLRVFGNRFPMCSPGSVESDLVLPPRPWRAPAMPAVALTSEGSRAGAAPGTGDTTG
jgi:NhaA family Na+:H+ antiporter